MKDQAKLQIRIRRWEITCLENMSLTIFIEGRAVAPSCRNQIVWVSISSRGNYGLIKFSIHSHVVGRDDDHNILIFFQTIWHQSVAHRTNFCEIMVKRTLIEYLWILWCSVFEFLSSHTNMKISPSRIIRTVSSLNISNIISESDLRFSKRS